MAWDHGFRHLQIGVDNKSIVHLLAMSSTQANENAILVKAIRELLARDWMLKQIHAQMLSTDFFFDPYSASKLFTPCALSTFSSLEKKPNANLIFTQSLIEHILNSSHLLIFTNLHRWNLVPAAAATAAHPSRTFTAGIVSPLLLPPLLILHEPSPLESRPRCCSSFTNLHHWNLVPAAAAAI
ncbi:hypothetical protein WN944_003726 [Citrus x changshan-huyou]|uniref:RNase H type-1 domain-containing protein n=1 Tax=Citrus x changshan-huyou TaxID=2935761 RepID=A0AAP0LZ51_9ROSI